MLRNKPVNRQRFALKQSANQKDLKRVATPDPRHVVPMPDAFDYIFQFLNSYGEVGIYSLGGFIDRETLEKSLEIKTFDETKDGLLFWYCYNPSTQSYPQFFLAFTHDKDFPANTPPKSPDPSKEYYRPSREYTYYGPISPGPLLNAILRDNYGSEPSSVPFGVDAINFLNAAYRESFPNDINGNDFKSNHNCALFLKQEEGIVELLKDDAIGISYFFGINTSSHDPRHCIVLIAVGPDGRHRFDTDALVLERHWPPD